MEGRKILISVIAITITLAIISSYNDDIGDVLDKIIQYLGTVAIPLVIWYLGVRAQENEKKLQEDREYSLQLEKEKSIDIMVLKYKEWIIQFLKILKNKSQRENGIPYGNWYDHFRTDFSNHIKQCTNGEGDTDTILRLLRELKIIQYESSNKDMFCWLIMSGRFENNTYKEFYAKLDDTIMKFENGDYNSDIKNFIIKINNKVI